MHLLFSEECLQLQKNNFKTWISRYVKWRIDESKTCCGRYIRDVCVLGPGDLGEILHRPELFANKMNLNLNPEAYICMEKWHIAKVMNNRVEIQENFYSNLDAVVYSKTGNCPKKSPQVSNNENAIESFIRSSVVEYKSIRG